eukprot:6359803-Amphidinium_carterae.1
MVSGAAFSLSCASDVALHSVASARAKLKRRAKCSGNRNCYAHCTVPTQTIAYYIPKQVLT